MVVTYRVMADGIEPISTHEDMNAASSALPQGAYTTFRTYQGKRVLRLGDHLRRLELSMRLMGCEATLEDAAVQAALAQAIQRAGHTESRLRLTFAPPELYISIEPFHAYPAHYYEQGVRCVSVPARRENPQAKNTEFVGVAAQTYRQLPPGVHEGLMLGEDGSVLEGLSSNFFAILDEDDGQPVLHTEEARVLHGVTRALVLEVAASVLPIVRTAPRYCDLPHARECFITSVSREIMPVVQVDEVVIGEGVPGPITHHLRRAFQELVAREAQPLWTED
ncbi:MAG: aminotransferase class IV [Thermoflexales bacterium]